ncbi:GTPase activating factor [Didymosphaeria variabile]|uniref:GTPase activating factor n=1 Tax=Didymosphaeria variabile TaxID=1932322 RepID=A0A9W9C9I2_9PLEO|nr:GTPase activating factor [Didymosphaeria variabile]KAJ4350062.1 GTPase activating factor [Didymosphaeria variabile]
MDPPPRHSRRSRREEDAPEPADRQRDERGAYTIRAVTPELIPEDTIAQPQYQSPPVSPRSNSISSRTSTSNPRNLVARANSNDTDYALRNVKDPQTRPRTRTMEERSTRDKSPPNLFVASRHRIGSVHSTASSNFQSIEESVVTSIGHPSTISPTAHQPPPRTTSSTSRSRLLKQPARAASPVSGNLSPNAQQPDSWVSPVPASDARKILKLMRATKGKMQGMLAFRRGESSPWSLSYCYINDEAGSLVYEPKSDNSYHRTLIPDLRGCRVKSAYDAEAYTAYIHVVGHNSKLEVYLRPPTQEEFDSWFAALMCWQPIRPKGIHNKMAKPQTPLVAERRLADSRRHSEVSLLKEAPIIKVGKMIYWDTSVTYSNTGTPKSGHSRPQAYRIQSHGSRRWRRVSCTLRENGELKLYSDTDVTLVSVVQLSQLSRCAVQRLDPSVLDNEFCIAIYPQYTSTSTSLSLLRPIFLSLESRVLYEVWIVLLRAFTIPQLYGPKQPALSELNEEGVLSPTFGTKDMFRMERSLFVRVIEARLMPPISPKVADMHNTSHRPGSSNANNAGGYYVEVLLDGETRARTMVKMEGNTPFWREEFEFLDLPAVLSTASLLLKKRPPSSRGDKHGHEPPTASDSFASDAGGGFTGISFDQTCGKTDIYLDDLGPNQEMEKWWPLVNMYGNSVGEVLVKVSTEEGVILMARDYQPMSELLHRFSNGLTLQLAQMVPNELKKLSEYLLNIFQVSGQAGDWIMALVEEEIDGTLKESPATRLRFSKRLGSSESSETHFGSNSDRELFVRDMNNNAKLEANLLFRGNTLLTKSLDFHMKRLGKEYLEETLSDKLREINEKDPECEVDPNKVSSQHELDRNWRRLINLTEDLWRAIYNSVSRCPQELRLIFRHIRACAEDRFGDFLRTVKYSSVSGFLFLRFFVPAVLNPKLFGLLKDHPKPRARRALTLIAKSLQGLANMTSFGTKEAWMEPMNSFLNTHRQEFKTYLDNICSISSMTSPSPPIPPSYSTPLAILQRLPPTSREGFPSLPYLVDHARNFAALVDLWLENTKSTAPNIETTDGDLLKFHQICVALKERTSDCLNRAERAERPSSSLSVKWEELVEQLQGSASFDSGRGAATKNRVAIKDDGRESLPTSPGTGDEQTSSSSTSTPVTMKPVRMPRTRHQQHPSISASASSLTSTTSNNVNNPFTAPKVPRHAGYAPSLPDSVSQSASTNASASASATEETPPGSSDGLHMAPPPSYPQTRTHPSASAGSFGYANPNAQINTSALASSGAFSQPPRSAGAGAHSVEGSDAGSMLEEEYTTALPAFSKDKDAKEKKDRSGFRGVLPFQRKRKDKEKGKEKDKEHNRDRSTDRNEGAGRGGGSALGEYASHGSLRGRAGAEAADF